MLKKFRIPDVRGELMERVVLNAARLCSPIYRPDAIYTQDKNGWPGDWEGRTILALVSHMKCLKKEPAYLNDIITGIHGHLNEAGYLGGVCDEGVFDEQQLSGHNWLIRGLMEYYLLTGDETVSAMVRRIVKNLYLPLAGYYSTYPLDPEVRKTLGSYSGTVSEVVGHWILSTDIGCAFMCLDGLSQYYEIYRDQNVLELLKEMISVFAGIDFVGSHMQTHATLSAVRGILRVYLSTGDEYFKQTAVSVFDLYVRHGMTENYANFNWFGRYNTWTEPCAITDSLMSATELFKITGDTSYLVLACRIYYNAFCYAQRYNGGFGTDKTVGPDEKYLKPSGGGISEAFWCCTMRGAEGLSYLCENSLITGESGETVIPFGGSFRYSNESYSLDFESKIPYEGKYSASVCASKDVDFTLKVFNGRDFDVKHIKLSSGEKLNVCGSFEPELVVEEAFTTSGKKYFYGNLLLGTSNPNVPPLFNRIYCDEGLQPLSNMKDVAPENIAFENRQLLF